MTEKAANNLSNAIQKRYGLTGTEQIRSRIIVNGAPLDRDKRLAGADTVAQVIGEFGIATSIETTKYSGHAGELAEQAHKDGIHIVVFVGGDGTLHEGVDRLTKIKKAAQKKAEEDKEEKEPVMIPLVAFIPGGTQNVAAKAFGTPTNAYRQGTVELFTGEVRDADLIRVNAGEIELYSLINSGVAFAAHLMDKVEDGGVRGRWESIKTALRLRTQIPSHELQIINTMTGKEHMMPARVAEVVNAGLYGGMFQILPTEQDAHPVKIDDGILDFFAVPHLRLLEPFQVAALMAYGGTHKYIRNLPPPPGVLFDRSASFAMNEVNGENLGVMHVDGNAVKIATSGILYTNEPQEVTLVVPTQGERSYFS